LLTGTYVHGHTEFGGKYQTCFENEIIKYIGFFKKSEKLCLFKIVP